MIRPLFWVAEKRYSRSTTPSPPPGTLIRVQEREAGFFCDVEELLRRFVPQTAADRLKHLLFLLGPGTEQIPFVNRALCLGQWQRVMLFDLEGQSRGGWTLSAVG